MSDLPLDELCPGIACAVELAIAEALSEVREVDTRPVVAAIDEALRAFIARRMEELPDADY